MALSLLGLVKSVTLFGEPTSVRFAVVVVVVVMAFEVVAAVLAGSSTTSSLISTSPDELRAVLSLTCIFGWWCCDPETYHAND